METSMRLYRNVVQCAIEHDSKFLIIKRPEGSHAGGVIDFPGGKVERVDELYPWDMLRAAVKREVLKEEVGLDLNDALHYIMSSVFVDSWKDTVIDSLFHCKVEKTDLNIVPSAREVSEYYWMTSDEIKAAPNAPQWLTKYLEGISANLLDKERTSVDQRE